MTHYWMKKLSNYSQKKTNISKEDQIKKLKERIEDLEGIKEFQQEIASFSSRKTIGWSLEDSMKVSMVKEALSMAYKNCIFKHKNIIHQSDRGIQYCCPDYSQYAENMGFTLSTTQQYEIPKIND